LVTDVLLDGGGNIIDCIDDSIAFHRLVKIVCIQEVAPVPLDRFRITS